jgi:enamine deaminase RidA (YjgF/YER057c/UK114 family)
MKRSNLKSGVVWEDKVGYSRVVRVGNVLEVAGTVSTKDGQVIHAGDAYKQACFIIEKIKLSLEAMGSCLEEVVRTRMYVVDIDEWEKIGKAHGQYFKGIDPVTTMIEVSRLIDPEYLVEIEASAIVGSGIQNELEE